jgi:hypothetical protein
MTIFDDEDEMDEEEIEKEYTYKERYFKCDRDRFLRNIKAILDANPRWAKPRFEFIEATGILTLATHEACSDRVFKRVSKLLRAKAQCFSYS